MGRSVLDELEWLALVAIVEDDQSDPRVATQVTQRLADSTVVTVAGKA
jgi:ABC-type branched-subunit amino acid transport system substrate-binding protein